MRIHFNMTIRGEETIKEKLDEALRDNPAFLVDIVKSFGMTLMLALRLKNNDNVTIENFCFAPEIQLPDTPEDVVKPSEPEKKVVKLEEPKNNFKGKKQTKT